MSRARLSIKKKPATYSLRAKDITLLTRQLATLLKAGIPLMESLDLLNKGWSKNHRQGLLHIIKKDLESGLLLSQALAKYPRYFDVLYCALVAAGEQSGTLALMLERLASYKEKMALLKQKVQKSLLYPSLVIFIASVVTAILLLWIVPQFEQLFHDFGAQLPAFTRFILRLSSGLQTYGLLWVSLLTGILVILMLLKKHHKNTQLFFDKMALKLFIFGRIFYQSAIARFSRTLATTFSVGVPLPEGLHSAAKATNNYFMILMMEKMIVDVKRGLSLQRAMQASALFPDLALQMVSVGEESGKLSEMLHKIADFYDEAVDVRVATLGSLLEPIIMVILGVLMGSLVIAIYLPIFKMGQVVG